MKLYTRYLALPALLGFLLLAGCERELGELNLNPNAPEAVAPRFLLSNVIYHAANNNAIQGWLAGNFLAQHTSNLEFLPIDRYDLGTNTEFWEATYRLLNDIESMREAEGTNASYHGAGLVLRAYLVSQLTDLWTDVPVFEALQGRSQGNFTPVYDRQQDIYMAENGILDMLSDAVWILESSQAPLAGDILFEGDLEKWIRFANSLRIRYLLRISNRVDVRTDLEAILADGRIMEGPEHSALVPYLTSAPNQWFIYTEREGRYADVRMSATIDSVLHAWEDPRMETLFKPTISSQSSGTPAWKGIPNGLSRESQNAFDLGDVSLLGARFRDEPDRVDAVFMRYDELMFALAEAAERGLISADPVIYYEGAIAATFTYLETAMPVGYLSRPSIALDGSDNLNRIMTQKWASLMLNGFEAWLNIRRTDLPRLTVAKDNLNNGRYPVRFRYPETEQAANASHYQEAVNRIGGDTYNAKGWWE